MARSSPKTPRDMTLRLIQCDLANHSKWIRSCAAAGSIPAAFEARQRFAEAAGAAIKPWGFTRMFWRGDGGVFFAPQETAKADETVEAARAVRDAFLTWQANQEYASLGVKGLAVRISCHHCLVWGGADCEYWTSDDLNQFTKFERQIAQHDAIAVTGELAQFLVKEKHAFGRVSKTVLVEDPEGPGRYWRVFYDAEITPSRSTREAGDWFTQNCGARYDGSVVAESQRFTIGDSIVVYVPPIPTQSIDIEFTRQDTNTFDELDQLEEWRQCEQEILSTLSLATQPREKVDREKVAPLRLRMPLEDFPLAKVTYTPMRFSRARSFLRVLENRANGIWSRLAAKGIDYEERAPLRPGMAGAHMLLRTDNPKPMAVLAQRSRRQDPESGIQLGQWSASCEETMSPDDGSIEQTARRGLKEEILGDEALRASLRASAIFIERNHLSLCIAMVCHTDLSLPEIVDCWRKCRDHDEHSQLVGLPLEPSLIKECIAQDKFTDKARQQCLVVDKPRWENTQGWEFVTTSAFRLALALWTFEQ
jgi:hypothetical protein